MPRPHFPGGFAVGPEKSYRFGQYRLLPDRRVLLAAEQELPVRGRAFDLLLALIERRERPVAKDELLSVVWPGRIVEEGNLTVHIAGLRKLLGGNIIATLSGRGYRFVAPVEEAQAGSADPYSAAQAVEVDTASEPGADSALPRFLTRLIGRQEDLDRIEAQLQRSRLVTIVGAGGVGKTSIALAAADRLRQRFPDGVWFVEFSSLADPALAPAVIASALGIHNRGDNVLRSIALFLARLQGLLILDGCERLLSATALTSETLLHACPDVAILATSREPLRAAGESLHRVSPLAVAPAGAEVTTGYLAQYSASDLFVERAQAINGDFQPDDVQAREIMEICRRLDGMPLAIELAVSNLQALTLIELKRQLDHRFDLLTAGRRTALPHQQTLRATIDWSFERLSSVERELLARLSVFSGGWTAEAANYVAHAGSTEHPTIPLIAALVDKSLMEADLTQVRPRYRMLDSTRFYASEKLAQLGIADAPERFARWLIDTYRSAEADWPFVADSEWFEQYAPEMENLRAALTWAFGSAGDAALGVELTSYAEHVWTELSLATELRHWFDLAISRMTSGTPRDVAGRLWLGRCGWLAIGDPHALAASEHAVEHFRAVGNDLDLGRALWRHAYHFVSVGDTSAASPFLQEAEALLRGIPPSKALVSCLRASALARARDEEFDSARVSLEEALLLARRLRSRREIALALGSVAELEFASGRIDAAMAAAIEALATLGDSRDRSAWVQHISGAVASYLLARNQTADALPLALARLQAARVMGMPFEVTRNLERLGLIAARQEKWPLAARLFAFGSAYHAQLRVLRPFSSGFVYEQLRAELNRGLTPDELAGYAAQAGGEEELVAEVRETWQ